MEFACLDLVNSEQWDGFGRRTDHLEDPAWIERFMAHWGLAHEGPLDAATLAGLYALRTLLRRMVEDMAGGRRPSDEDLALLDATMAPAPVRRRLMRVGDSYQLDLVPIAGGGQWILAEVAASAAQLLAEYDRQRIKACANPGCRWAFYDESRGNTRRWCDDRTCGNRDKVRRFRKRRLEAQLG